jgi:hypothetical protein
MTYFPPGVSGNENSGFRPDPSSYETSNRVQVGIDSEKQLTTRGAVLTDEGSFRDDFTGASLATALSGTSAFSGTSVVGTATSYTTQVQYQQWIKLDADSETSWALVAEVIDDTHLTLDSAYSGGASGAASVANWATSTGTGGSITVGTSNVSISSSTSAGSIYIKRAGDYLPMVAEFYATVDQRRANQTVIMGFRDNWAAPRKRAEIQMTGTDPAKITLVTSAGTAAADIQSTTVSLPNSGSTVASHEYSLEIAGDEVTLSVDGNIVASNSLHVPGPYDTMDVFAGIQNSAGGVAATVLALDVAFFQNVDRVEVANSFGASPLPATISQSVELDPNNSSLANIAGSGTFTGTATPSVSVAGIQVLFSASTNCTVYVEQSADATNWDISDAYEFNVLKGNFGVTTQAVGAYVRVRVVNKSSSTATNVRLTTVLCPVVEAVPRALDPAQNLKVGVYALNDKYGDIIKSDPMGSLRVEQPYRLVGTSFSGTTLDVNFWTGLGSPTVPTTVISGGVVTLTSGGAANNYQQIQTVRLARFIFGHPHLCRSIICIPTLSLNRFLGLVGLAGKPL